MVTINDKIYNLTHKKQVNKKLEKKLASNTSNSNQQPF